MGIIVFAIVIFFLFWLVLVAGLGAWAFFKTVFGFPKAVRDLREFKASGKPWFTRKKQ